ncbi:hypothetical protein [Halalkalibacter nanhaiisediminis]|uniref:Uncharacterized protein n=1 Tax=Halalkalibacter nanhaiisediminis TaxID=688079 RepID=A0A562QCL6_9BACI|nr:hypothetical protein [Halalkalibacter nanhaiisediminis]TWI54453.1 hypothetical protein IQ10_03005 [Halalkalibacter nanhaiisediminis]
MCGQCQHSSKRLSDTFVFILSDTLIEKCNGLGLGVVFTAKFDGAMSYKITWDQKVKGMNHDHSIFTHRQVERAVTTGDFIIINSLVQ